LQYEACGEAVSLRNKTEYRKQQEQSFGRYIARYLLTCAAKQFPTSVSCMHASIKTDKKHRNRTPKKEAENGIQIEQNKPQSLLIYCTYDEISAFVPCQSAVTS
jgi:hypothetical protein